MAELPKAYDPHTVEKEVATRWEEQGYSNPDNLPERHQEPFVVMMPPPNVTGTLHMGHALEAASSDALIRRKRMQGRRVLWLPGLDHASIAVHNVIEKRLKKEGRNRFDLGREEFLQQAWEWKEKYGGIILDQLKRLGVSADWSRTRFTLDEGYTKSVETAFKHYYDKGWIYKGKRVINWCPRCATPLSDLELEYLERDDTLWRLRYPLTSGDGFIIVATTRPETMLGDSAVAVHPSDERYKDLVGKMVLLPIAEREIPIVADESVEKEFGTGAVKVTPAHDLLDAEIGMRHNLPLYQVIDEKGRMMGEISKSYHGLKTKEAREKIITTLREQNLLENEEAYKHNVATCYRCGTLLETIPSEQWFLKMSELAKGAAGAYRNDIDVLPERWERVTLERLANERDWCISRQLWWGHKIPLEGENDILDTWFSSALWPFATLGWPEKTDDLARYYPNHWMTSGRDILFLWINRMVFSGLELMENPPFPEVFIHPTVLTKDGKRMSKSLGTGIDPMDLIEKYGADAVRFGLLWQLTGAQDIRFDESAIIAGKKFLNKLWNATRYVLGKTEGANVPASLPHATGEREKEILTSLEQAIAALDRDVEEYRFGQALENFYNFFWHTFCDRYLEATKESGDEETKRVLLWVLATSLRTLHPLLPFVTDELWEKLPHEANSPLAISDWSGQRA